MTKDQALTVADESIVSALSAAGEIMPASVRHHLGGGEQLVLAAWTRNRSARLVGTGKTQTGQGTMQVYSSP